MLPVPATAPIWRNYPAVLILLSTNSGSNFNISVSGPTNGLSCVAVSSDCTKLVAGKNGGLLYASANAGATWTPLTTEPISGMDQRVDVARRQQARRDDRKFRQPGQRRARQHQRPAQHHQHQQQHRRRPVPAVELQYIGNGSFMPVSSTGILWAN